MSAHEAAATRSRHLGPLTGAFVLVAVFMVVEAIAGLLTGSLALISDAGHMATDTLGLGMSIAAVVAASRTSRTTRNRTYGLYRGEILAALANAVLLFIVAGYVLYEAVDRIATPPDILTAQMAAVAAAGLAVNIVAWLLLRRDVEASLNVEGAYLEVLGDLIGSVGVLVAAIVIGLTGWTIVDPILAAAVGVFILPRALRLARKATRILVEAAPPDVDLEELTGRLAAIPGVVDVHDLHVWTLTSEMEVATTHLMTRIDVDAHAVLDEARSVIERAGVGHATIQVEPETHQGCAEISW